MWHAEIANSWNKVKCRSDDSLSVYKISGHIASRPQMDILSNQWCKYWRDIYSYTKEMYGNDLYIPITINGCPLNALTMLKLMLYNGFIYLIERYI